MMNCQLRSNEFRIGYDPLSIILGCMISFRMSRSMRPKRGFSQMVRHWHVELATKQ